MKDNLITDTTRLAWEVTKEYIREGDTVIDATCGHKTRAVLVTDSEHIVLSPLLPETVTARIDERREPEGAEA